MRVELGEVEHALSELPGVDLAVALVRSDPGGAQRLVAYVTPASVDTAGAIAAVRPRLPAHMVPSVVVPLARMPLLPNGKIARKVALRPGSLKPLPQIADPNCHHHKQNMLDARQPAVLRLKTHNRPIRRTLVHVNGCHCIAGTAGA